MTIDQLIPRLLAVAMILLISFPVHEFAHALAAYRLGDGTAKLFGRLTLNPIAHFDPLGGLILIASAVLGGVGIGWAKPTPVNPANLQGGRQGDAIVAFAGPASNLVLAAAGAIPLRFILSTGTPPLFVVETLGTFVLINIALMLFNLLPIPPLDGSKVLFAFLSPRATWQWRPVLEQYGIFILLAVAFLPLGPNRQTVFQLVFNVIGLRIFDLFVGTQLAG